MCKEVIAILKEHLKQSTYFENENKLEEEMK